MNSKSLLISAVLFCTIYISDIYAANPIYEYPSLLYLHNNYQGLTKFKGVNNGDLTGVAIASGDVNGDGLVDIVVGATEATSVINRPESGVVYILYGSDDFFTHSVLDPTYDAEYMTIILGLDAYGELGFRITCGDVDGDLCDDIIIGATGISYHTEDSCEKVYVLKGSNDISGMRYIDLFDPQTNVVTVYSDTYNTQFGFACSSGDYNNDGCDDIVIGAPQAYSSMNEQKTGRSYLIPGSPYFFDINEISIDSEYHDIVAINGNGNNDAFGIGATSGDYNGDGFEDIAIGAWTADRQVYPMTENTGKVYVFWGSSSFFLANDYTVEHDTGSYTIIIGEQGMLGHNLSSGDLNSDGVSEILAGAHTYSIVSMYYMREQVGALYCIWGDSRFQEESVIDLANPSGRFFRVVGANNGDHSAIGMVADVNSDGNPDLVVGSPEAYFYYNRPGIAYVIFGPIDPETRIIDLAVTNYRLSRIIGEYPDSGFCRNNMVSGDIDGDGLTDMVLPCVLGAGTGVVYAISGDQRSYTEPIDPVLAVEDDPQECFTLAQNYPNPFNPVTTIQFELAERIRASVKIYNVLGSCVAELIDEVLEPGAHSVTWDASENAAGVYLYCLEAGNTRIVNRMVLVK